jgi:ribonuclease HII
VPGKIRARCPAQGFQRIAGVDEVGRGALFGPVFAAAVILSPERPIRGLRDSKLLDAERREVLAGKIRERAVAWSVGAIDAFEIDRINILQASRLAMRAPSKNSLPRRLSAGRCRHKWICPGPARSHPRRRPIAVHRRCVYYCEGGTRDACMREWDLVFPVYGLKNHKGYSTPEHWKALETHGPTALHRFSFWPVREHSPHALWTGYPRQGELFEEPTTARKRLPMKVRNWSPHAPVEPRLRSRRIPAPAPFTSGTTGITSSAFFCSSSFVSKWARS